MPFDALLDRIRDLVQELGYELADVRRAGTRDRPILKVRIDRPDSAPGRGITADDCTRVSRALERSLEGGGLVGPQYLLEVSSPGIDRPLTRIEHWRRFQGQRAKVRAAGLEGRTSVEIIGAPDDEHVRIRLADGTERTIALADVRDAALEIDWKSIGKDRR
jgi:ribosome maturation factor RimP